MFIMPPSFVFLLMNRRTKMHGKEKAGTPRRICLWVVQSQKQTCAGNGSFQGSTKHEYHDRSARERVSQIFGFALDVRYCWCLLEVRTHNENAAATLSLRSPKAIKRGTVKSCLNGALEKCFPTHNCTELWLSGGQVGSRGLGLF